jgi:hypothetical protein
MTARPSSRPIDRRRVLTMLGALGLISTPFAIAPALARPSAAAFMEGIDCAALHELAKEFRTRYAILLPSTAWVSALLRNPAAATDNAIASLRKRTLADYEARRIVELAGWYLSHTEAALLTVLGEC